MWALPFFTVLAPSERYHEERGLRHRTLAEWAYLMVVQVRDWLPRQKMVLVADSTYAVLSFLHGCAHLAHPVTVVTRVRLDARLYAPPPARLPGTNGRPRTVGARLPNLPSVLESPDTVWTRIVVEHWYSEGPREVEIVSGGGLWYHPGQPPVPIRWVLIRDPQGKFAPQALLCTDPQADPMHILSWFVRRWQMETTFQAVRTHLGVETQRQWNDLAIARATPVLLALFSLVTLLAHPHFLHRTSPVRQASWYAKDLPTFADAIACVRSRIWRSQAFCMSSAHPHHTKTPAPSYDHLIEALCYAM